MVGYLYSVILLMNINVQDILNPNYLLSFQ